MKKVLALFLALTMIFGVLALAGCSKGGGEDIEDGNNPDAIEKDPEEETEEETEAKDLLGPVTASPGTAEIGSYTLSAEWIPFDEMIAIDSPTNIDADYADGTLYLLDKQNDVLREYTLSDGTAVMTNSTELDGSYEKININFEGKPLLSKGVFDAFILEPDGTYTDTGVRGYVTVSKTKDVGFSTWVTNDVKKIENGEESTWILTNLNDDAARTGDFSMIFNSNIVDDYFYVAGNIVEENGDTHNAFIVYDFDGNIIMRTQETSPGNGDDAQIHTDNGYMAVSVDYLSLWDKDGYAIGYTSDSEGFLGLSKDEVTYVWSKELMRLEDGSILLLTVASKTDDTKEALLFKITGF